jgi:hypothetical protein
MFHQEIHYFLIEKNNNPVHRLWLTTIDKDIITNNVEQVTVKILNYLTIILKDKDKSDILLQEFLIMSSEIRKHERFKVANLIGDNLEHYEAVDIYNVKEMLFYLKKLLENYFLTNKLNSKFLIIIKDLNSKTNKININSSSSVLELKYFIMKLNYNVVDDIEVDRIILIYNGKKLKDDSLFYDIDIEPYDIIYYIYKIS